MIIQLNNIKLNYEVIGEGKAIIFLHGFFGFAKGMIEFYEPIFQNN
jgi:hypothetical protein